MEKKILFLDLDGTLLTDKKEITQENADAIERAVDAGHAIVICTGRPRAGIVPQLERLGLNKPGCYAITNNGAELINTHTKEILFRRGVPSELLRFIFDEAYKHGLHAQTYSHTHVITEKDNDEIHYYSNMIKMPYLVVEDASKALDYDPIKVLCIHLDDKSKLEAFRMDMVEWCKEQKLDNFFSCDRHLEFLAHDINKGSGVRFITEHLGIPFENTLAAGDAENDITMLQAVHTPCVMKNALPEMYEYAAYITENDNNHSGVAEIIEKFMLS